MKFKAQKYIKLVFKIYIYKLFRTPHSSGGQPPISFPQNCVLVLVILQIKHWKHVADSHKFKVSTSKAISRFLSAIIFISAVQLVKSLQKGCLVVEKRVEESFQFIVRKRGV